MPRAKKPPLTEGERTRKANKLIDQVEPWLLCLGFQVYAEEEDFICYVYFGEDIEGITMLDAHANGVWDYYDQSISLPSSVLNNQRALEEYLLPTLVGAKLRKLKLLALAQLVAE